MSDDKKRSLATIFCVIFLVGAAVQISLHVVDDVVGGRAARMLAFSIWAIGAIAFVGLGVRYRKQR